MLPMVDQEVSEPGIFAAIGLSLIATFGQCLTTERCCDHYNAIWLAMYGLAILILAGASVNFNPKRWLR
jgi:hypothetical protein